MAQGEPYPELMNMRLCRQLVYVRHGRALVSGCQTIRVPRWPDGMRSAWVAYEEHDGGAIAIGLSRLQVLEAVA